MTTAFDLFGTDDPPAPRVGYSCGPWAFTFEDGALRHIKLHGVEAIRCIAFLVRDRDWGTLVPTIDKVQVTHDQAGLTLSFDAAYASGVARLDMQIVIALTAQMLSVSVKGHAIGLFETNRAGFTVLHPIADVAGQPVQITHGDGTQTNSIWPELIAPLQPFMDIAALTHRVGKAALTCRLQGDTFEMEDQRQWGDASFKTYNRPLAAPWPYALADGESLCQSVALTWTDHAAPRLIPRASAPAAVTFPDMALLVTPQDALRLAANPADIRAVNPQRILCHLDATAGDVPAQYDAFAQAQRACPDRIFDLELICAGDADPAPALMVLASRMRDSGFAPASVLVCPAVDRQSTPPGSVWPACAPLAQIHDAAAAAFPDLLRGGGMVSFFPELNRKRPPVDRLGFVSHGLCPIVHAADDLSVMETLQAIPHITASARAIIGDREYRIGPATLAMRQNPYGARTIANPSGKRLCMTDDDPRHRAQFGAAYVIGLATALVFAGISVWCPAALYGPRGVIADTGRWPIQAALNTLAALAGQAVHRATIRDGIADLHSGDLQIMANLTASPHGPLGPYGWTAV
jgi:D-apionolactonase